MTVAAKGGDVHGAEINRTAAMSKPAFPTGPVKTGLSSTVLETGVICRLRADRGRADHNARRSRSVATD